jgi:ATP-dependent Clp endopeptidase proteolytic subunit ClpP
MNYCIDINVDEPIFLINKHIGFDEDITDKDGNIIKGDGMGVDGALFQQELLYVDGLNKKRIQVWMNTPGGSVTDGYNIYSAILKTKTPVDTYCIGAAASIGGVIFQAGRKRIMADYAWLMYHNPFYSSDDKKVDPMLQIMQDGIAKMISSRSGITEDDVLAMMSRTSFISASEALEMKLCDQVDSSATENTKYLKKIIEPKNFYKECNKVLNSILNPILNNNTMQKVTMRLKLNDAATEDNVVKAIDEIENRAKAEVAEIKASLESVQNKAKADSDEMDKLKAKMKKLEEDKAKNDAELEDCKNKLSAMESDKNKAEEKAAEEKAKNMVEGFAKAGRIKNEATVILEWTLTAKTLGFDKVKSMIEALPLNKSAISLDVEPNKLKEGELPTTAMGLLVKNRLRREGKI